MRKLLQGVVICAIGVAAIALVWRHALSFPQIWMLVATSILANVLQPSYNPLSAGRSSDDRGTALQIVWSIYAVQLLNIVEFLWARPELHIDWGTVLAFALMLGGLALRTWAVATLGRWFSWHVELQPQQQLVVAGPYRFVRHPSYTGAFLTFVSACALLESWIAMVVAIALLSVAFARRVR
jgi:protein-S-isoprenylcysteine O-methyltransferase